MHYNNIYCRYLLRVEEGEAEFDDLWESELEPFDPVERVNFPDVLVDDDSFLPSSLAAAAIPSLGEEQYPASLPPVALAWERS